MKHATERFSFHARALSWVGSLAGLLILASTAPAQQFDRKAYQEMVEASSEATIPPGTRITVENWTKYKRFMPVWLQMALGGKFHFHVGNGPEYVMEVAPTGNYLPPRVMRDDTEKYAGQTQLVPQRTGGFGWSGYKAGVPFPNPTQPNKAAKLMFDMWAGSYQPFAIHEMSHNWETDSFGNVVAEDTEDSYFRLMHLSDPPYPINLPDSGGSFIVNRYVENIPEQAKYTTALELESDDPARLTEEYAFLPTLRRSLRLSSASRCTPILGTDYLADDMDWKPGLFRPVYYGEKKILTAVADEKTAYTEGSRSAYVGGDDSRSTGTFPGWPKPGYNHWEVRDAYIINLQPLPALGSEYCYSQRIFYIDKQTLYPFQQENYARNGRLYHLLWTISAPLRYKGERTVIGRAFAFSSAMDLQNAHASPVVGYNLTFDATVPSDDRDTSAYTPGGLARIMK